MGNLKGGRTMKKVLLAVCTLVLLVGFSGAKKLDVLKFDKGEMPNDVNQAECSLAEEHAMKKGGVSCKVTRTGDGWWVAECPPKRRIWDGFDVLKIGLFNPQQKPLSFNFVIKPKSPIAYEDRFDYAFVARPGQNEIEVELTGACTNGGKPLSLKDGIAIWGMDCGDAIKKGEFFFLQYMRLETADEGEKDEKAKDEKKK
jgi:hypothetical protein